MVLVHGLNFFLIRMYNMRGILHAHTHFFIYPSFFLCVRSFVHILHFSMNSTEGFVHEAPGLPSMHLGHLAYHHNVIRQINKVCLISLVCETGLT